MVAVGSHDTASAVAAVPADTEGTENFAYISSGTWSLVGVELHHPVLTEASRAANFTNERGVDGTIRYLRNVGGLWLLSECQRTWAAEGLPAGPRRNCSTRPPRCLRRPADQRRRPLLHRPGQHARTHPRRRPQHRRGPAGRSGGTSSGASWTASPPATPGPSPTPNGSRTVHVGVVHIVGGGSQNRLLCQLTADATGKRVIAGPVEATALGNVLVQARAAGVLSGGLGELRAVVRRLPAAGGVRAPRPGRRRVPSARRCPVRIALFATCIVDAMYPRHGAGHRGHPRTARPRGHLPGRPGLLRADARQQRLLQGSRCPWSPTT